MQLDDGNYSDPVLHLIAFKKWVTLSKSEQPKWAFSLGIRIQNMIEFVNTVNLLLKKVNRLLGCVGQNGRRDYDSQENIDKERFIDTKSLDLSHTITARELNYFRLMITWVSTDNIIRQVKKRKVDNEVKLKKQMISVGAIKKLFPVCRETSIIDDKEWRHDEYSIPFEISYEGEYVHRASKCNDFILVLCMAGGFYLLFHLLIYSFAPILTDVLSDDCSLSCDPFILSLIIFFPPPVPLILSCSLLCPRIHPLLPPFHSSSPLISSSLDFYLLIPCLPRFVL